MSTPIAAAVGAVVTALQAAPAVCTVVDRVRLRPVALGVPLAVAVRPVQSEVTQATMQGCPVQLRSVVAVDCYARANPGVAPDAAVDALLEAAITRLLTDPTLSGTVVQLQPKGISYDFDADGQQTACASVVFEAIHRATGTASFTQPT